MSKSSSTFTCTACGASNKKWNGQCDACMAWNTLVEESPLSAGPKGPVAKGRTIGGIPNGRQQLLAWEDQGLSDPFGPVASGFGTAGHRPVTTELQTPRLQQGFPVDPVLRVIGLL